MPTFTEPQLPTPPARGPFSPAASSLVPASAAGQVATFVECLVAIALLAPRLSGPAVGLFMAVALAGGVAVGLQTGTARRFTGFAGWAAALVTAAVSAAIISILGGRGIAVPAEVSLLLGTFVLGLDWLYVSRLRAAVMVSGLVVVPLVGNHSPWAVAGGLVWFGGALVTFWVLERDARASVARPATPAGLPAGEEEPRPTDLLSILVPALLVGMAAALLIGNPSCSPKSASRSPGAGASAGAGSGTGGQTGSAGRGSGTGSGSGRTTNGGAPGVDPGSAPLYRMDGAGHEQSVTVRSDGSGTITGSGGTSDQVESQNGRTVVRDGQGSVIAQIDGNTVTVAPGGQGVGQGVGGGADQTYTIDGSGRLTVRGADGQTYALDESGGSVVLRAPDGQVVASGPVSADHLYVRDPGGRVLIPGADGDGNIPIPDQAVREGLLGQGRTYSTDAAGHPVVSEPDGTTHVYGTDAQGRPQVQVTGPDPTRTYVYDESGGTLRIVEFDAQGRFVRDLTVDPQGREVSGPLKASGPPAPGSALGLGPAPAPSSSGPNWWLIGLAGLVAVAAVAALGWWWARRTTPPARSWAETMADRLEHEGGARGRPRRRDETVVGYSEVLGATTLADARMASVGQVVSAALFGPTEPPAATRRWAEETVTEIVTDHPAPRWTDRFRRRST